MCLSGVTSASALTLTHLWSQRFGDTGGDRANSVAVDGSRNVCVTGGFAGTVNFGSGDQVSAGFDDIFVAKYDANGTHLWSHRFGGTLAENGYSIAVDGSENVFVTGFFQGTVDFGGGDRVSAGQSDIFVAKYDASGAHLWSQRYGGTSTDNGYSIAADGSGNVFVTGSFRGTVDFGGGDGVSDASSSDIFVAKYDANGMHLWSRRFGSTLSDLGAVATDGSGNVFVTGSFRGTVDFGGGDLVSDANSSDIFVAKYDASGAHLWSRRFGSTGIDAGNSVAVDGSGNVFVTGDFTGAVDFGGGPRVSAGGFDIFVAKYNASGTHLWSQRFGSTGSDDVNSVAVDGSGNVFVTGDSEETADFGGGDRVSAGSWDIFVAEYDPSGVHLWSERFGSAGIDFGLSVAVDGSGDVAVAGFFQETVDFGGGDRVSAGFDDIFVAKYGVVERPEPVITTISDVGNDQGGQVVIRFDRSSHDQRASSTPIQSYEVYRRDDSPPSTKLSRPEPSGLSDRGLLADGWLFVGSAPAHEESAYGVVAPTIGDSTVASGPYYSVFFIRAATAAPGTFFDSPVDSGYSLDNLDPGVPSNLFYSAGQLTWDDATDEDFDYFTVYGSNVDDFGSATVVDYAVAPSMDVTASVYNFYYVTATDFSGNEGKPAKVNAPSSTPIMCSQSRRIRTRSRRRRRSGTRSPPRAGRVFRSTTPAERWWSRSSMRRSWLDRTWRNGRVPTDRAAR